NDAAGGLESWSGAGLGHADVPFWGHIAQHLPTEQAGGWYQLEFVYGRYYRRGRPDDGRDDAAVVLLAGNLSCEYPAGLAYVFRLTLFAGHSAACRPLRLDCLCLKCGAVCNRAVRLGDFGQGAASGLTLPRVCDAGRLGAAAAFLGPARACRSRRSAAH